MDEETRAVVLGLCLHAATLMEDRSPDLVSVPLDVEDIGRRIALIEQTGQDLAALGSAARVLWRALSQF